MHANRLSYPFYGSYIWYRACGYNRRQSLIMAIFDTKIMIKFFG